MKTPYEMNTPEKDRIRMIIPCIPAPRRTRAGLLAALTGLLAFALPGPLSAQDAVPDMAGVETAQAQTAPRIAGSTVLLAGDIGRLELELASGDTRVLELNSGQVLIDGERVGTYEVRGEFDRAWRALLRDPAFEGGPEELQELLAEWEPPSAGAADVSGRSALLAALDRFDASAVPATADPAADQDRQRVTIVPRAGSLDQLAERLSDLNATLGRIAGEEFGLDGDFALVVHDDYTVAEGVTIEGDVALLGGELTVEGAVEGDVLVLGGDLLLEPGATVFGDVRSIGGHVEMTEATVTGEILSLDALDGRIGNLDAEIRQELEVDPEIRVDMDHDWDRDWERDRRGGRGFFGTIGHNVGRTINDLVHIAFWILALTLLGALAIYFAPERLETIAAEARADVLRSFGIGLAGQLLFFPILLLLIVLIVTWLVVPFYLLAVAVAVPVGYLAVARGLGEAVVDRKYDLVERFNLDRQNTYYYVLNGLLVLFLPFAVAALLQVFGGWLAFFRGLLIFLAVVLSWAAATTGFGAVILTRGGGLMRDFPSFRRKRSVPLDDLRPRPDPEAPDANATRGDDDEVDDA